jgi:NDP-sugar pyrophosphorylase family protein
MKAIILAAGLGTRLQPLTNTKPKALVEIQGITLLELQIQKLKHYGFKDIIINIHHFGNQIVEYLHNHDNFGIHIEISDETGYLLDTGGGIKQAAWFLEGDEPFLAYNVDILTDLDLNRLYERHRKNKPFATLAVMNRNSSRVLLMDKQCRLRAWKNKTTGEIKPYGKEVSGCSEYAFSGIHIIDPKLFSNITEQGRFSIIDVYLRLAMSESIQGYVHNESNWMDAGCIEELERAATIIDIQHYK